MNGAKCEGSWICPLRKCSFETLFELSASVRRVFFRMSGLCKGFIGDSLSTFFVISFVHVVELIYELQINVFHYFGESCDWVT